jgi:3-oxoisoapionate decarboxylase
MTTAAGEEWSMKIGISSWSCSWAIGIAGYPQPAAPMDAIALLDRAADVSAEVLQIADNLPLHDLPQSLLLDLARQAKERSIALEVGTRGMKPENLLRYLEIAKLTGAKLVRTLPHDGVDRPDFEQALCRLAAIKSAYEAAGVTLAVENHGYYPSEWLKSLVMAVDSPFIGVCLDAVNNLGLGESFREVMANLGSLTINFHCKDYRIDRKPTMLGFDITGTPAGEGMLDLVLAGKVLRKGITWVIESWLPWQGDLETTIAVEKEWLIRGIYNLTQARSKGRIRT